MKDPQSQDPRETTRGQSTSQGVLTLKKEKKKKVEKTENKRETQRFAQAGAARFVTRRTFRGSFV